MSCSLLLRGAFTGVKPVPRTFKAVHGDDGVKIDDVTDALAAFGETRLRGIAVRSPAAR